MTKISGMESLNCQNCTFPPKSLQPESIDFEAGSVDTNEIIACCIINFLIETLGNGFLVLMIINERYLMDPQKRTTINQIATYMNYSYILNNIVGAPLVTLTIIFDDIGEQP